MSKFGGLPKAATLKVCAECHSKFHPNGGAQVCCSEKCRGLRGYRLWLTRTTRHEKVCRRCGLDFSTEKGNQKECLVCLKRHLVGVGTGNWQTESSDNGTFKHGKYSFSWRYLKHVGTDRWFCERCGADLREVVKRKEGHGLWGVHHRDRNRNNQKFDNLELLCSTCHNREHANWNHRKG